MQHGDLGSDGLPFVKGTLYLLFSLWCLHVFWAVLILKVFKNSIWEGVIKGRCEGSGQ